MAIYHLTVKIVSRARGQSAVAKAAYNSHDLLTNEKTDERHDYRHKGAVLFSGIFAPQNAPEWARDRQALWSQVERVENRKNSQLAREVEVALPHELTDQQREYLVKDFVRENFVRHGMVADVCIHAPSKEGDQRNHHAHILLTMREIGPEGFGAKMREFNSKTHLKEWREKWEHLVNRHLERYGHEVRVDSRSLEAQGADREPTIHKGPTATQFEREGVQTERGDVNREIEARNRQRKRLRMEQKEISRKLDDIQKVEDRTKAFLQRQEKATAAHEAKKAAHTADRVVNKTANVAGRLSDGFMKAVDGALDFLVGAPPPREYSIEELASDPAARRVHYAQKAAGRERDETLDRWAEQLKENGNEYAALPASDVRHLNKADLENIKANGDDAVRAMIAERERERSRDYETGGQRERER